MKQFSTVLSLLAVLILAGCGGQQPVTLSYAGASPETVAPSAGSTKVYLVPFGDKRPEKEDIGDLHNGYGFKIKDVVLSNDPAQTVTDAVKQELENAGYQVVMATSGDLPADAPMLSGDVVGIDCCSNSFGSGMTSKLSLDATMSDAGIEKFDQIYVGEGSNSALLFYGQEDYQDAMSAALQNVLQQLIADVTEQAI